MSAPLPTRNEAWGFYGTIRHNADPDEAWPLAFDAVAKATGAEPEGVRDFLDATHGRHFADTVSDYMRSGCAIDMAIRLAVQKWQHWKIGSITTATHGIPTGLPFLTGWVHHYAIPTGLPSLTGWVHRYAIMAGME